MKRGTPRHPKMLALARALDIPITQAVGIMEMLWHFTSEYAPRGDIGRFSDEDIAEALCWSGDVQTLMKTLLNTKWLDLTIDGLYIVHDWSDHCDDSTRRKLKRRNLTFISTSDVTGQCTVMTGQNTDMTLSRGAKPKPKPTPEPKPEPPPHTPPSVGPVSVEPKSRKSKTPYERLPEWKRKKFDEFWEVVWARIGKQAAAEIFGRRARSPDEADRIIQAAKDQGPAILAQAGRSGLTPLHPRTWLHEGRYEDELPPAPAGHQPTEWERMMEAI